MIPIDYLLSRLTGEPFCMSRSEIEKLDPVSARLLYFRNKSWDDDVVTEPIQLTPYDLFVRRFLKQGYLEADLGPLWSKFQEIMTQREKERKAAKQQQPRTVVGNRSARGRGLSSSL